MNQIKGLIPIIGIILIAAGGYFFAHPQYTSLNENKIILEQAQQENASLKKSEMELNTFLSSYRSQKSQADLSGKILPLKKPELESILANLDTYATNNGISLASASFTDQGLGQTATSKLTDYQITYVEIIISASGSYPAFRSFLSQLENSLRLMDITSVNIIRTEDDSKIDYKLITRVYYQK